MLRQFFAVLAVVTPATLHAAEPVHTEVVVYGATPAGVMAAVAAARQGHSVALIDINNHLGGVVSGGLTATDIGDRATVGGLADEFFKRIEKHYATKFGPDSPEFKACRSGKTFEPHVAELVFDQMVAEQPGVKVFKGLRYDSVTAERRRITSLTVASADRGTMRTFTGDLFIDASYEGDVMAGAKVPYRVGREARSEFGEQLGGVCAGPMEQRGLGDHRTMAYNYRVCVTSDTANRVLFPKPEHYEPEPFTRTDGARAKKGTLTSFGGLFTTIDKAHPHKKYDANWCDFPGNSEGYAEGDWTTRDRIAARIRDYFQSRLYYLQNDPELPESFRAETRTWGLPADEFADNGHFPFQLYIREARRMIGRYVLREKDLTQDRWKADGVATGGYGIDCHTVQLLREGNRLVPEHTLHVACNNYDIPYASLVPPDVENLLVPVCISATHVAYCSIRMEPVYMMLGHAAGDAAHLALAAKTTVQKVNAKELRELLLKEGAVLDAGYQPQVKLSFTPARPKVGERIVFKAVPGAGLKDSIKQVVWDFDGSGRPAGEGERVVHAFDMDKVYTVSVLVIDAAGRKRLLTVSVPVGSAVEHDTILDELDADLAGRWNGTIPQLLPGQALRFSDIFSGPGIHRDQAVRGKTAPARARFQPTIDKPGRYLVCLGFRPAKDQATNTPVTIRHAGGTAKLTVDQRKEATPFNFVPLGEFTFEAGNSGFVEVTNGGTDGRVAIDGARWVWLGE